MSWGFMASPVLKMQAASQDIQPSTPSSRGHWPALVSALPWSLSAWLTMEGGRIAWLWAPDTEAWAWCGTQQLWTPLLRVTIKTASQAGFAATKAEATKCQKYHDLQSNYLFNQWQLRPLVCMASPPPLFWVVLRRNLLRCLATPGAPVAPPASVPGCDQGKCCQYIGLCASLI